MHCPFKLPVVFTCPKCFLILSAPGVGIEIRPLKSSEQPETSPEFIATQRRINSSFVKHKPKIWKIYGRHNKDIFTKFLGWDGCQNRLNSGLFLWLWGRPVKRDSCRNFRVRVDLKGR